MKRRSFIALGGLVALATTGCVAPGRPPEARRPQPVAAEVAAPLDEAAKYGQWAPYRAYFDDIILRVQKRWELVLAEERAYPKSATSVEMRFRLNADGRVEEIVSVEGTAGEPAKKACVTAVTSLAPFAPWTGPMIATLGESQELAFTFFYQ